jgi:hypothetical protein
MPTNLDLARPVSASVEIQSVNLAEASVKSLLDPTKPIPDDFLLHQAFRASYELADESPDTVVVQIELTFTAGKNTEGDSGSGEAILTLNARYALLYSLPKAATFPADSLAAFAELNGTYNVWPYWREMVQTVTGRVGLAAVIVPVLRLPVKEVEGPAVSPAPRRRKPRS